MKIKHILPLLAWLKSLLVKKPKPIVHRIPSELVDTGSGLIPLNTKDTIQDIIEHLERAVIPRLQGQLERSRESLTAHEFDLRMTIDYRDDLKRSLERLQ